MAEKHKGSDAPDAQKIKVYADISKKTAPTEIDTDETPEPSTGAGEDVAAQPTVEDLGAQLEKARKEAADSRDQFLRAAAELDNFKKRTAREMETFHKFAAERMIKDLLPVVDNLERALVSTTTPENNTAAAIAEGVQMTLNDLKKVFEKYAVSPIDAIGQLFDPAYHQAVMQEETADHPENTVIQEFQKGYMIHDRLLRPAMVVVAKPKADTNAAGE